MRNLWIIVLLMASMVFLSHCGRGTAADKTAIDPALASVQCISGVYEGEIDVRWGLSFGVFDNYDAAVSLAFAGDSLLVKVKGDQDEVLCTRYDGAKVSSDEEDSEKSLLTAEKITSSRILNEKDEPDNLGSSLYKSISIYKTKEGSCSFDVGSVNSAKTRYDETSIEGEDLTKSEDPADFNTLLEECGGVESFKPVFDDDTDTDEETE